MLADTASIVGLRVKLHGLVNAPQHNDKIGLVISSDGHRLCVKLLDGLGKRFAVKLDNLRVGIDSTRDTDSGKVNSTVVD